MISIADGLSIFNEPSALSWEYEKIGNGTTYIEYWTAKRGPMLVGRITADHHWNSLEYSYYFRLTEFDETFGRKYTKSFEEAKKYIEDKFEEIIRDADLVLGECLPEIY